MKINRVLKFSIKGVPILPLLLMGIVTAAAVVVANQHVTSSLTIRPSFNFAIVSFNQTTHTCTTTPDPVANFSSINEGFIGTLTTNDNGTNLFCVRNTSSKQSLTFGGVGSYSTTGMPNVATLVVSVNDGFTQQDMATTNYTSGGCVASAGTCTATTFTLLPGKSTTDLFGGGSGAGYFHIDITFDGTESAGTYSIVTTINGSH